MAVRFWKQWKLQIICVLGGILLYAVMLSRDPAEADVAGGYLERGNYGEEETVYEFLVEGLEQGPVPCRVEVPARRRTKEEAAQAFERILDDLAVQMLGANRSPDQVRDDLTLPTTFEEAGIGAVWYSDSPDILDSYGRILEGGCPPEGAEVWMTVELSDGVYKETASFPVKVFPKVLTEEERLGTAIAETVRREAEKDPAAAAVRLPEEYEGRRLRYRQEEGDYRIILLLGFLMAGLFYIRDRKKGEKEEKRRREQLMLDYADVVYQLMVFVGAGLTAGRAWERIVENYETRVREKRCLPRPAYEAMADAQARMRCGVPEGQAIMEFGEQCRLQPYRKLSGLLEQNRRTGTKNLTQLLEQEMAAAWEQQKNIARRLGEEAGTKLLLPLLMMLIVVMVIIMVPAMLTM